MLYYVKKFKGDNKHPLKVRNGLLKEIDAGVGIK